MQPFNPLQALIQSVLTILLPILIGGVCWVYRLFSQRLPEHQAPRLEQFARMAVQYVEQEHGNALDKKNLAIGYCADLFRDHDLPVPRPRAIETAIGSAFYKAQLFDGIHQP